MSKRFFNRLNKFALFFLTIGVTLILVNFNGFAATYSIPQTTGVKLSWDHNDPLPEGYRVFQRKDGQAYDYSTPVWTGANNSCTVYNLEYDTLYYFVVRAYEGTWKVSIPMRCLLPLRHPFRQRIQSQRL
jgi:hypothetical protein